MGFAPIHNLAEKETFTHEYLAFPGDESLILAISLDPFERFAFVAKGSNKLYSIDLAADSVNKRPFISKIVQLDSDIVQLSYSSKEFGLWVLLENGKILNFSSSQLQEGKFEIPTKESIGFISEIKENVMILGGKSTSKIFIIYFEDQKIEIEEISVPFKELNCGSKGISSLLLLENGNSLLFSCKLENSETENDVPLILLENILNGEEGLKFSFYFDPCASRPPRVNHFYFINCGNWSQNLVDFVVLGNFASPDIGICGRTSNNGDFESFYIDNDEGLAQLPFINGNVTYPVGLALDFSSKTPLDNLTDPDGEDFPPAPILWILTNSGHLCPFSMLKTNLYESLKFMKAVPNVVFDKIEKESESRDSNIIDSTRITPVLAQTISSNPQTPSKVPLQQLASLQKSTEIKPIESISSSPASAFSFKPAPVVKSEPADIVPPKPKVSVPIAEPEPVLIKREEKMEALNVGPYQSILLTEIASTHAAMQEDIFTLKQLALKNTLLLRQNSQKYFNSLELLESYAEKLEKLLKSSSAVFIGLKDKVDVLKFGLNDLLAKTQQVRIEWNRIKQDRKINWDSRVKTLSNVSEDLFESIDRLRNFLSSPADVSKYRATLKCFVDSVQEKLQLLMAHISGLFVTSPGEDNSEFYAGFSALSLGSIFLDSDNIIGQLNILSLSGNGDAHNVNSRLKKECLKKSLLKAAKSRGAHLQIPTRTTSYSNSNSAQTEKALKLSSEDESLIKSFASAIKLTEEVPEFAEIDILSKLSLNEELKPALPETFKNADEKSSSFSFSLSSSSAAAAKPKESLKPAEQNSSFRFSLPSAQSELKPVEKIISETKTENSTILEPKTTDIKFSFPAIKSETPSFNFVPIANVDKSNEPKTIVLNLDEKFENNSKEAPKSLSENTAIFSTKIPSIFTASFAVTEKTTTITPLKKESPMPSFDSLKLGSSTSSDPKPFPSIFGVNLDDKKKVEDDEKSKILDKTEKDVFSPALNTTGFSFVSKPKESNVTSELSIPASSTVQEAKTSSSPFTLNTTTTIPSIAPSASPSFSFSFAPNSGSNVTSNSSAPAIGFSISDKPSFTNPVSSTPVFGTSSIPSFGATSLPTPAFGQTSVPSSNSFGGFNANSNGFAAFANSSSNSGFSAFVSKPENNPNETLTFASFLPTDKKQQPSDSSSSSNNSKFSFSGFRE